jgi:hypothetical protein
MPGWGMFTLGSATASAPTSTGGQWAHAMQARGIRVFPPRIRHEYWVEQGHQESSDPALDTRES